MIRVYFASKLTHGAKWRGLCEATPEIFAHARWLKHNKIGTESSKENAVKFWLEDEEDIETADFVVVYGEAGEHLRGALVEAGIAIAFGKQVIVVGEHQDYGTWQWHPNVLRMSSLEDAIEWMSQNQ
jgi:nucleoside 2-deoxyribosyltransferase